jgi:pimeloyl-ACP methyl ester carboxylesterase
MTAATTALAWREQFVEIGGVRLHVRRRGHGRPLLVLHHDIGSSDEAPLFDALAERYSVYLPAHPGYDRSERPAWMRSVRDVAVMYQWLLANLELSGVSLLGLGFGGWIAAEMATMAPRAFDRLVLVGAMGVKPPDGDILDQALLNYIDYARAGFHDQAAFDRAFGAEPSTDLLEQWDINREMTFRIAWKPYMYNPTLPHLLGGVRAPALIVWGDDDRIVPRGCGELYASALPDARLVEVESCGHFVDLERPTELARLIGDFVTAS